GVFAHVEEERALVSARGRRSSVELLDPQSLLARGGIGRGVAPYIVVSDDGKLLSQALCLFGIGRKDDDWRSERHRRAHAHGEGIVRDDVERAGSMTGPEHV